MYLYRARNRNSTHYFVLIFFFGAIEKFKNRKIDKRNLHKIKEKIWLTQMEMSQNSTRQSSIWNNDYIFEILGEKTGTE